MRRQLFGVPRDFHVVAQNPCHRLYLMGDKLVPGHVAQLLKFQPLAV